MTPRLLALTEGADPERVRLPSEVADAIGSGSALRLERTATPGEYLLSSAGKVGVVTAGEWQIVIEPKMPISRLIFLLGYAKAPGFWTDDTVHVDADEDMVGALVSSFVRFTRRAVDQGVLQGYATVEDVAPVLRGRINESEQIRRVYGRSIPLHVRYDDYSVDTPENQILLTAVRAVLRLPVVTTPQRASLHRIMIALEAVTPLTRGVTRPAWTPSRLNSRFVPALRLAEMILDGESIEQRHGQVAVRGFLVNLNKVFEDFVCVAYSEALRGHDGYGRHQRKSYLDSGEAVEIKPDFLWLGDGEEPVAVMDAKYKSEKPAGFPNADVYQMLAYCTAFGLREGHLVYARGQGPEISHYIPGADVKVHCHALDLEATPADILAEIARLAREMVGVGSVVAARSGGPASL